MRLEALHAGQQIPFGGDRVAVVDADLAARFRPGDRLVVVQDTGDLLIVPAADHRLVDGALERASEAFGQLADCSDDQITHFFNAFAGRLDDDAGFAEIQRANQHDVDAALARQRQTGRLVLDAKMRSAMIDGLRSWADAPGLRSALVRTVDHDQWRVGVWRAPLGVVGFVFEGRPNVLADAVGVVRTGNTVVLRIGSDALETARAIVAHALAPALLEADLPVGTVGLVDSPSRAAGWALFGDRRLGLAVARGSGPAVAQLGAVAQQSGVPVSLHGTGGAWMVVSEHADAERLRASIINSLDRKVCNTLNVVCITTAAVDGPADVCLTALEELRAVLHIDDESLQILSTVGSEAARNLLEAIRARHGMVNAERDDLGIEWEWDQVPELSVVVVDGLEDAAQRFNRYSPRFVVSLISELPDEQERFYDSVQAPFVGDGFTRWVDGQYAFSTPELGLSNWETGRLLGRSAVLSGDSAHTLRVRASISDPSLRR
jgi:glutamate-5-semialdehyde dehydrogenase